METNVNILGGVTVFEIVGEIDGKTAPEVQEKVIAESPAGGKVILDMSGVPYMSSAGLRIMLTIYRHVTGSKGSLALVGVIDEIKETMEITGFLDYFTFCDTVDEGIKTVSSDQ